MCFVSISVYAFFVSLLSSKANINEWLLHMRKHSRHCNDLLQLALLSHYIAWKPKKGNPIVQREVTEKVFKIQMHFQQKLPKGKKDFLYLHHLYVLEEGAYSFTNAKLNLASKNQK
eukprot:c20532_g1_i1 orf=506-853(+)